MTASVSHAARDVRAASGDGRSFASVRLAILASLVISFLAGSSAPTPLYATYQAMWGFSAVTTTVVFGTYAVAVLFGLLFLGRLSDHVGRKPVLYVAVGFQVVAMALFATANDVPMLLVARVVQGVSTGAAVAAVGAAMLDIDRVRGAVSNAVAPGTGTAIGALVSALMVVALPAPTHLVYLTLAVVFVLQALLLGLVPETSSRRPGAWRTVRPTLRVPDEVRGRVLAAAPVLFAVWALAGFYGSLGPGLVSALTGTESIVLGGTALFVLAGVAALSVFVLRQFAPLPVLMVGIGSLIAGVAVLLVGVHAGDPVVFFIGTAVAGVGFGGGFQGGLRLVLPEVQPEDRAGTLSVLYIVSYLGMGVPAVGAGELVVHGSTLVSAAMTYGTVIISLAVLALLGLAVPRLASSVVLRRAFTRSPGQAMASEDPGDTAASRTPWNKPFATPLRAFLLTESGSAGILAAAIVVAFVWANLGSSYESVWTTPFGLRLGDGSVIRDLRTWVNEGLMTLFFLVIGLEARREIDLGDLRERGRALLPVAAGLFGLIVPVGLYLAVNAGGDAARGWGVAMSTDTALALGLLVVVGREVPDRVRAFLLTVFVVDDIVALLVIAVMYTDHVDVRYLALAVALFGLFVVVRRLRLGTPPSLVVIGLAVWASMLGSGVDPIVSGLAIGLAAPAYAPARENLKEATGLFRQFREEPTPDLARTAVVGLRRTLSPNDRLRRVYHPWTSYVIVPLFALANAGIAIDGPFLRRAMTSSITLGIVLGYVVGKPLAVTSASWAISRMTRGRLQPAVGWASVTGSGAIAGIGFTVAFLVAAHAFEGEDLAVAKFAVLLAAALAALATWAVFRITALLDEDRRTVALHGRAELLVDLAVAVDPERDHVRGSMNAAVTVVEYGDFQCPYCGQAEPAVQAVCGQAEPAVPAVLGDAGVRFVWRHLPLTDVHPEAELAAQAAEAAGDQGRFWEMHDLLLNHQDHLLKPDLLEYAERLGLDLARFEKELQSHVHQARVAQDVESADMSGVSGTPTFFVNGRRQYGTFDPAALTSAIEAARARDRIRRRQGGGER